MQIKIKTFGKESNIRVENKTTIREVLIQEDFQSPKSECIQICFSGKESSGVIEMSRKEFEKLDKSIKPQMNLFKIIK
ncbi:MAG: hypothetical protein WC755_01375 [Candidatus Woesearchaeota archaeon]|jgi:hypothetical protein